MTRPTSRMAAVAAGALAVGAVIAGCGDSFAPARPAQPAAGAVDIKTFMFRSNPARVSVGTTVTWDNKDDILHTVTSGKRGRPTGLFDKKVRLGDKFSYTFDKPGTYHYVCTIHMGMDATIIVS